MSNSSQVNLFINKFSQDSSQNKKSAEILKSYVPYEIQKSYIFDEIFNAYGEEFDRLGVNLLELFLQILELGKACFCYLRLLNMRVCIKILRFY